MTTKKTVAVSAHSKQNGTQVPQHYRSAPKTAKTAFAVKSGPATKPVAKKPKAKKPADAEDGVTVNAVLLVMAVLGMIGSGALLFSTLNVLTAGLGLAAVAGILAAEFIGGHVMTSAKGAKAAAGLVLTVLCMGTEVFLAIDREDMVARDQAHIAAQQAPAGEAMEDCSSKDIPKGLGSKDRLDAEQKRVDQCNERNAGRAARNAAATDKAATKGGDRSPFELAALIGLALACSLGTALASAALTAFTKALKK